MNPQPPRVRLSQEEIGAIKEALDEVSDDLHFQWYSISLFGSRTNLQAKGGDIDLFITLAEGQKIDMHEVSRRLKRAIQDRIGEQKTDIVIDDQKSDIGALKEIIQKTKVDLWTQK